MVMGAPHGVAGGRAKHRFEIVEWVRDLKEHEGLTELQVFELISCIARDTLNDWLYYRTRTRA